MECPRPLRKASPLVSSSKVYPSQIISEDLRLNEYLLRLILLVLPLLPAISEAKRISP
jgi:hypothetical protein